MSKIQKLVVYIVMAAVCAVGTVFFGAKAFQQAELISHDSSLEFQGIKTK
jgi:hypothetical protein